MRMVNLSMFYRWSERIRCRGVFQSVRGIDEAYVYDNSFLKLRELSLSYPVYKKDNLNVNVNVFARNIIVWSEIKGFDPEATQGNNNMAGAFERFLLTGYI